MSWEAIRAYTATLVSTTAGIGNVYEYRRNLKYWAEVYSNLTVGNLLNNWEITRSATTRLVDRAGGAVGNLPYFLWTHRVNIIGHMGLNDELATEQTFQTLVSDIIKKLNGDPLMGAPNLLLVPPPEISAGRITEDKFAGVLCHYTEITFDAIERTMGGN